MLCVFLLEFLSCFIVIQGGVLSTNSEVTGLKGSNTKLSCNYTGVEQWFAIQWKRKTKASDDFQPIATLSPKDDPLFSSHLDISFKRRIVTEISDEMELVKFDMEIFFLRCSDAGIYQCTVLTVDAIISNETNLSLKATPSTPQIDYDILVVEHNETFPLKCSGNVGYPAVNLEWYYRIPGMRNFRLVNTKQHKVLTADDECTMRETRSINITVNELTNGTVYRCKVIHWLPADSGFIDFDEVTVKLPVSPQVHMRNSNPQTKKVVIEKVYTALIDYPGSENGDSSAYRQSICYSLFFYVSAVVIEFLIDSCGICVI